MGNAQDKVKKNGLISLQNQPVQFNIQINEAISQAITFRLPIATQYNICQAIKDQDIESLQNYFQVQGVSLFYNIQASLSSFISAHAENIDQQNSLQMNEYFNSMHLAFELQKPDVIDYFLTLSCAQNTLQDLLVSKNSRRQDIFDICTSKGVYLVDQLIGFGCCESYSLSFIEFCVKNKIKLSNENKQNPENQDKNYQARLKKYLLKNERIEIIRFFGFEGTQLELKSNISQNTQLPLLSSFKYMRVSEILRTRIQDIHLFPEVFDSKQIEQSENMSNCYLVAIIKSLIISNQTNCIRRIIRHKCNSGDKRDFGLFQEYLSFSGKYEISVFNRSGSQRWLTVDDRFYFNQSTKVSFASNVSENTIYFNLIEKAMMGVVKDRTNGIAVQAAFIALINAPVIDILVESFAENPEEFLLEISKWVDKKYPIVVTIEKSKAKFHSVVIKSVILGTLEVEIEETSSIENQLVQRYSVSMFLYFAQRISVGIIREGYFSIQNKSIIPLIKEGETQIIKFVSRKAQEVNLRMISENSSVVATIEFQIFEDQDKKSSAFGERQKVVENNNYFFVTQKEFLQIQENQFYYLNIKCKHLSIDEGKFIIISYSQYPIQFMTNEP